MGGIPKLLGALTAASLSVVAMQATAQIIAWPGVSDPVEIIYDDQAVPHIYAANKLDAAFAQGFAHAEQRFWQMDYTRRAASGTLGEMLGQAALSNDIQLRTLGLRRAAWETFSQLPADMRARLQAYANGVNAWLATNELPPEYGVLELSSADPWTPVDSVVVGKILAFQLSFDLDIDATIALGTYQAVGEIAGFDGTALFFEDTYRSAPPDDRVTVPGFLDSIGGVGKSATVPAADALKSSNVQTIDPQTVAALKDLKSRLSQNPWLEQSLRPAEKETGSNWWMVDAAHSANGSAMIAFRSSFGTGYTSHLA